MTAVASSTVISFLLAFKSRGRGVQDMSKAEEEVEEQEQVE